MTRKLFSQESKSESSNDSYKSSKNKLFSSNNNFESKNNKYENNINKLFKNTKLTNFKKDDIFKFNM